MTIQLTGADLVDIAVQTETRGEKFYQDASQRASDPESVKLFTYLAEQEARHRVVFAGLSAAITVTEIDNTTWEEAMAYIEATVDQAFFAGDKTPIAEIPEQATVADMLRMAIEFEQQTLLYFYTLRDLVQPQNRDIVDQIVAEERSHVLRLGAMLQKQGG